MNVLITGATGMLGSYLSFFLSKYFNIYLTSSSELGYKNFEKFFKFDLNNQNYDKLVEWSQPEIIIHCGAITDLNYCEKNMDKTIEINSDSVYKFLKTGTSAKIQTLGFKIYKAALNQIVVIYSTKKTIS